MASSLKWFSIFIMLTAFLTLVKMDDECPTDQGWIDADNLGCFFFVDVSMTFYQAQDYCYKKDPRGVLAEIHNEETDLVIKIFSNQGANKNRGYWIGGNDIYNEGTWTWLSGTPFEYRAVG